MVNVSVPFSKCGNGSPASVICVVLAAVPREDLGKKSKQEDSYKD
jgi:hypothetical protein